MKLTDRRILMMLMVCALLLFPGASAIFPVSAQQKPPARPKCPVIQVSCPAEVFAKDALTMTVNVSGGDPNVTPTYNWSISAGALSSGQGTAAVEVNTSEIEGGSTVTATVEVGGLAPECSRTSSCTTSVMKKAEARKFDEYGKLRLKDEGARLDNFAIQLMNDPTDQAHIISYNGIKSRPGDAQKTADRSKNYLIKTRGLDPGRVAAVAGGSREEPLVELWIVPSGALAPSPTPTMDPSPAKSTPKAPTTKAKKPIKAKKPAKSKA